MTILTDRQSVVLKFVAANEGELLPGAHRQPPEVQELVALGLIESGIKVVDNDGPSDFDKQQFYLTAKGRAICDSEAT